MQRCRPDPNTNLRPNRVTCAPNLPEHRGPFLSSICIIDVATRARTDHRKAASHRHLSPPRGGWCIIEEEEEGLSPLRVNRGRYGMAKAWPRDSNGQVTPLCEVWLHRATCGRDALRANARPGRAPLDARERTRGRKKSSVVWAIYWVTPNVRNVFEKISVECLNSFCSECLVLVLMKDDW